MKFEKTKVMNFDGAFRGVRNPKESWVRSDSFFGLINPYDTDKDYDIAKAWMNKRHPELELQGYEYDTKELNDEFDEIDQWLLQTGVLQEHDKDWASCAEVAFIGPDDMRLAQQLIKAGSSHRKFMRQIFVSVDITAPLYW